MRYNGDANTNDFLNGIDCTDEILEEALNIDGLGDFLTTKAGIKCRIPQAKIKSKEKKSLKETPPSEYEKIRMDSVYKAMALALKDNSKSITNRESAWEDNLETMMLDSGQVSIPINNGSVDGSVTILSQTLPENTEGRIFQVGVDFVTNTSDYTLFSFLINDQVKPFLAKKFVSGTIANPVAIKIPLPNRTTIKIVGYNSNTAVVSTVRMQIVGYFKQIPREGSYAI